MSNFENQLSRMKEMMNYGLQTENKKQYNSVEYQKLGADGKTYGVVREGTKYYIKVSDSQKPNLMKEDFDYVGGFRNRKDHEYSSYANALKNFDMKLNSIKEAVGNKTLTFESWNPEKNEYLVVEATDKMKNEIERQRQIMKNASNIMENCGKESCCCKGGDPFCENPKFDDVEGDTNTEKNNIGKPQAPVTGKTKKASASKEAKTVKEGAEPLAWHKEGGNAQETMSDTYMDKSNGTEIGDGKPFEKGTDNHEDLDNGVVEEGVAMHDEENQNSPEVGTNEVGDKAPFTETVKEDEDVDGEDVEDVDVDVDDEDVDFGEDGADSEGEEENPFDDDEEEADENPFDDESEDSVEDDVVDDVEDLNGEAEDGEIEGLRSEIAQLKDMLSVIMDKVGASGEEEAEIEFGDDSLYDDNEDDEDGGDVEEFEFDVEPDEDGIEDEDDFEDEELDDDTDVFESRSYKNMKRINEDRLNDYGKHPAWRKHVMTLPRTGEDENEHGRDWNDSSVHGEQPYAEKIGSGAPFEITPEAINNAIAESIKKIVRNR